MACLLLQDKHCNQSCSDVHKLDLSLGHCHCRYRDPVRYGPEPLCRPASEWSQATLNACECLHRTRACNTHAARSTTHSACPRAAKCVSSGSGKGTSPGPAGYGDGLSGECPLSSCTVDCVYSGCLCPTIVGWSSAFQCQLSSKSICHARCSCLRQPLWRSASWQMLHGSASWKQWSARTWVAAPPTSRPQSCAPASPTVRPCLVFLSSAVGQGTCGRTCASHTSRHVAPFQHSVCAMLQRGMVWKMRRMSPSVHMAAISRMV